jgi:hypothetical protein
VERKNRSGQDESVLTVIFHNLEGQPLLKMTELRYSVYQQNYEREKWKNGRSRRARHENWADTLA